MVLGNKLLEGEKVYLTANERHHAEQWADCFNNFEFSYFASFHLRIQTVEQELARFDDHQENDGVSFGIYTKDDERYIGFSSFSPPDWKNRYTWLGISITAPDDWGKGYGTDAVNVMLRYAFYELNLHRVELGVFDYNPRAIRSYEKLGFVHEGVERQKMFRDGHYRDVYRMAILRHEWQTKS